MTATLLVVAAATVMGGSVLPGAASAAAEHYWIGQLGVDRAWQVSTGSGVTVGVLDTGVDPSHPDLAGAVRPGRAFPDLGQGVGDPHGHGTAVAMLIAGRGRNGATKGIAPAARILPVTTSGTSDAINEAVRWLVDQRVAVINMSVGRSRATGRSAALIDDAIRYANENDVVVVAAAGNSSTDTAVATPADRPGVLAISAVDDAGRFRADVSVSGPEVALAAPGTGIVTTTEIGGRRLSPDGTSYSAALASGVIALVRARFPDMPAAEVVHRVLSTARPAGPPGRDPEYGHGIVDPVAALTSTVVAPVASGPAPAGTATAPGASSPASSRWLPLGLAAPVLALAGAALLRSRRRRCKGRS